MIACLDLGSRTLSAVRDSGRFGVNVLAADREDLAHRFSTKEHPTVKWDGVEWTERSGVPWIGGAVLNVACDAARAARRRRPRDRDGRGAGGRGAGRGPPLVFWGGSYRGL